MTPEEKHHLVKNCERDHKEAFLQYKVYQWLYICMFAYFGQSALRSVGDVSESSMFTAFDAVKVLGLLFMIFINGTLFGSARHRLQRETATLKLARKAACEDNHL